MTQSFINNKYYDLTPNTIDPTSLTISKSVTATGSVATDYALKITPDIEFKAITLDVALSGLTTNDVVELDKIDFYLNPTITNNAIVATNAAKITDMTISSTSLLKQNVQARNLLNPVDGFKTFKIENTSGRTVRRVSFVVQDLAAYCALKGGLTRDSKLDVYAIIYLKFSRASGNPNINIGAINAFWFSETGGIPISQQALPITSIQ